MLSKFYPDLLVNTIKDISLKFLKDNNIKGLILDIDNTLVATHIKEADDDLVSWSKRMQENGIKLCIVSNASLNRVTLFNKKLNIDAIHRAYKPSVNGFLKGAEKMGLAATNVAMVGDQIFTDVYGGKKAGMKTILVKPIDPREFFFVRLKRFPEKFILKSYNNKKGHK